MILEKDDIKGESIANAIGAAASTASCEYFSPFSYQSFWSSSSIKFSTQANSSVIY